MKISFCVYRYSKELHKDVVRGLAWSAKDHDDKDHRRLYSCGWDRQVICHEIVTSSHWIQFLKFQLWCVFFTLMSGWCRYTSRTSWWWRKAQGRKSSKFGQSWRRNSWIYRPIALPFAGWSSAFRMEDSEHPAGFEQWPSHLLWYCVGGFLRWKSL